VISLKSLIQTKTVAVLARVLLTISAALLAPQFALAAASEPARNIKMEDFSNYEEEWNNSKKTFCLKNLRIVPHTKITGIDTVSVYRNKKLILRKSLFREFRDGNALWYSFPFVGRRAKPIRTFDGDKGDFLTPQTKVQKHPLTDVNGDGAPDIILTYNYGNSGNVYHVYSLGATGKELATFSSIRTDIEFMDVDGDGKCEALAREYTFFGWETCNACSPMPLAILKYNGSKMVLATSMMRTQPPTKEKQTALLLRWKKACEQSSIDERSIGFSDPPTPGMFRLSPVVWGDMLELIISGNSSTAFTLLDQFWKQDKYARNLESRKGGEEVKTSKETFKRLFLMQLAHSPHLNEIKKMNSNDPLIRNLKQLKN